MNSRGIRFGILFVLGLTGCQPGRLPDPIGSKAVSDSAPAVARLNDRFSAGRAAIRKYGCYTCHVIPGVTGARGQIGPSLQGVTSKYYLAGQLPNTHDNLLLWIRAPHSVSPSTVMPDMNVTEEDAEDIVVYLNSLH
jgi:cytochrome c2